MNEREIFAKALEQPSEAERRAFLDHVCDADMRGRIERLLGEQAQLGSFLEHSPVEPTDAEGDALSECDAPLDATIVKGDGSTFDDGEATFLERPMSDKQQAQDDEIPLGFLQTSSQPGSLGRLGHYEVLEVIGRGAFGTVLRAFDEKLQRVVAIKVLAPEMAATSPARKRFLREARSSAAVRHENVVAIYAVEDEPIPYLVMEYVPGKTLQQRLDEQGPLDLANVLRLGKQIADGLAAAHAQDLIHRDIKPGNILLEGGMDERVKITDFGLARTADDASMTQSGMIAGTPMYMAPEQAHGRKLDQRADLFSFGSVLYQMLSGRPPFRAPTTVAVLKRVAEDRPRPIREIVPEVPEWICQLIGHLHAKDPNERYGSAKEVGELLAQCASDLQSGRVPRIPNASNRKVNSAEAPLTTVSEPVQARRSQPLLHSPLTRIAATLLVTLGVLGLTEATGVTEFAATVIRLATGTGTLVIETDDPGVKIAIDGEEVTIRGGGVDELKLRPGEYKVAAIKDGQPVKQELVSITRNGRTIVRIGFERDGVARSDKTPAVSAAPIRWPADAPKPAIAPFDAEQAKLHQQAWADYLNVPVEKEIVLGRDKRGLDVKLTLVLIPPGEFLMGSSDEEIPKYREQATADGLRQRDLQWIDLEGPQRRVRITRPYYLSQKEFSTEQFRRFVEDTKYATEAESSGKGAQVTKDGKLQMDPEKNWRQAGKFPQAPANPVVNVTWNDATKCCEWLSGLDADLTFALPTEAQWEFACRAGTTTAWFSGDDKSSVEQYGWITGPPWFPHEIGQKLPNAFGLYDMHGNVWEWCRDSFHNYRDVGDVDPVGVAGGKKRMSRGGNCFNGWDGVDDWNVRNGSRSAVRLERLADGRLLDRGFRVMAALSDDVIQAKLAADASEVVPKVARAEPIHWPADAPPVAIAPFDAEQAKQHQQAWADYLGVPVEKEIALGGRDENGLEVKLHLVLIPPGEFLMGSSDKEIKKLHEQAKANGLRHPDFKWIDLEGSQRNVRITRPFYMSRTEITNGQFRSFAQAARYETEAESSGKGSWAMKQGKMVLDPNTNWQSTGFPLADTAPVIHVNWNDANACCRWLSGKNTELTFALPTEAQWEYACRAGTTTAWFCGDDESVLKEYAIVNLNWMRWVGHKKPNAFGLYDMHGNVWEWCRDSIANYRDAVTVDPVGPDGEKRIIRGGNCFGGFDNSWHNGSGCRSAVRYEAPADHRVLDKGFRVAAAIPDDVIQAKLGNSNATSNKTQAAQALIQTAAADHTAGQASSGPRRVAAESR